MIFSENRFPPSDQVQGTLFRIVLSARELPIPLGQHLAGQAVEEKRPVQKERRQRDAPIRGAVA
jgi:hypothetical protein